MTNLYDFEKEVAPTLAPSPRKHLPVPAPEMHGVAGTVGVLAERGSLVYATKRTHVEHFYRKYEGYAISDYILDYLDQKGVGVVLVVEEDTGTVYEYQLQDFADHGIDTTDEPGDPQTCVPVEFATRTWENHAPAVF